MAWINTDDAEQATPNSAVPAVFVELEDGAPVGVHDYYFDPQTGKFDYVDALPKDGFAPGLGILTICVRPIISPLNILDMLQSRKCVCGSSKNVMRSSCPPCYHALPPELQKAVYWKFPDIYEQAFLASLIFLIDADRTTVDKILAAVPERKD